MARFLSIAAIFILAGMALAGCASNLQLTSTPPNNNWLADTETGCKFAVKWLKPSGNDGGGKWRFESAQTAKWSGACVDGYASGVGTAIVSIRPVTPSIDPRSGTSFPASSDAHHPPYENLFYGNFDAGQPNGSFVIRYSNAVTAVAAFERGVMKGDPVVHFHDRRIDWVTLPLAKLEQLVTTDPGPENVVPRSIDPREATDLTFWMTKRNPKVEHLLDVSAYPDRAAFKVALNQTFPRFSPAPELLDYLIEMSSWNLRSLYFNRDRNAACQKMISLVIYPQSAWHCVYTAVTKNREKWVYAAGFADDATLLYDEIRRYLLPGNFAGRGVPLRLEDFLMTEDFLNAAKELLGPSPRMEQVEQLMVSAGMKRNTFGDGSAPAGRIQGVGSPNTTQGSDGPAALLRVGYFVETSQGRGESVDRGGAPFSYLLTGCGWSAGLTFEFDLVTKAMLKAEVNDSQGCL